MNDKKFEYLLRLADNDLMLSHRLGQWCGKGPALEEDMALTNMALDLIGQARMWLTYAGEIEGQGRDEDQLAFTRQEREYRNLLITELPNGGYADTLARQFFFDLWHFLVLQSLCTSMDQRIAGIAEKSLKEVAYHIRRSVDLVVRLGDGTQQSHDLMQAAFNDIWMYTNEMFTADAVDVAMFEAGIAPDLSRIREAWLAQVCAVFEEATLTVPPMDAWMQKGGKQGVHTENLGYILSDMQYMQRTYPGASW